MRMSTDVCQDSIPFIMTTSLIFALLALSGVSADYECLCSMNTGRKVYARPDQSSAVVATIAQYDCEPIDTSMVDTVWSKITINGQVGYTRKDANTEINSCIGTPETHTTTTTTTRRTTARPHTTPTTRTTTTAQPSSLSVPGHTSHCSSTLHYYARRDGGTLGQYGYNCYELIPHHYNWRHAERLCEGRGGNLAHIQTPEQQAFVQAFMMRYNTQYAVWIGLHDINTEEHFEWTAGTSLTYTNWVPGRKSNFQSHHVEDCVALIPYKQGMWDDIPCGETSSFGGDRGETHYVLCQYGTSGTSSVGVGK